MVGSTNVSIPVEVDGRFESGTVKDLTEAQITQLIRDTVESAIRRGASDAVNSYNTHVAKKRGLLRQKLETMITQQVVFEGHEDSIEIEFDDIFLEGLPYAEFHIDRRPGKGNEGDMFYENPTTPGTRPIDSVELMEKVKTVSWDEIRASLKVIGFEVEG
ncbi:MAG: hypothetical protein IH840_00065 [Candidatus Heimdallarchaeota archaeon]|nr:hypothetical protein [Candidatus Heimdallarchaeota archaeon]